MVRNALLLLFLKFLSLIRLSDPCGVIGVACYLIGVGILLNQNVLINVVVFGARLVDIRLKSTLLKFFLFPDLP